MTPKQSEYIVKEILPNFRELVTLPFANYYCKELVHHVTSEQRYKLMLTLVSEFIEISCNMHGRYPVSKLLESMKDSDIEKEKIFN